MKFQVNCDYSDAKAKQPLYKDITTNNELPIEQRQFQVIEKPNLRIYCSGCQLQLTRNAYVITKNDYYCVGCFANLDEFPPEYLIKPSLHGSFSSSNWDLMDEVVLTTGLRIWGYSNWGQIKEYMDYNQSAFSLQEIKQHYEQYHYSQEDHIIQVPSQLPPALPHCPYGQIALKAYDETILKEGDFRRRDSKCLKKPNSMKNISSFENQSDRIIKPTSFAQEQQPNQSQGNPSTVDLRNEYPVLGYNPKRGEFQTCYFDPDAEKMLDELQFYDTDIPEQQALKIELIQQYNRRLDERAKRKNFVLDYKLLDSRYQFSQKQQQQQADLIFQPYMRYALNHNEYKDLINDFSTLNKHQSFINSLTKIRKTTNDGTLRDAYTFLLRKRKKSIEKLQKSSHKPFLDKRRRKVFKKQTLKDGTVVLIQEFNQQQQFPISFENLKQGIKQTKQRGQMKVKNVTISNLYDPQAQPMANLQWLSSDSQS